MNNRAIQIAVLILRTLVADVKLVFSFIDQHKFVSKYWPSSVDNKADIAFYWPDSVKQMYNRYQVCHFPL